MKSKKNNKNFVIKDIAGNSSIALTYKERENENKNDYEWLTEIDRHKEVVGYKDGVKVYKDRVTVLAPVEKIPSLYNTLQTRGVVIDHFYDY